MGIYARNWGAATQDLAEGVHRPLTVTALTLQSELSGEPLVLVALDGCWWKTHEDEWLVRGGLLETLSLKLERVMVNLSHTHAGPSLSQRDKDKPGGTLILPYLEKVRDATILATRQAIQSRTNATLTWSLGKSTVAQNRAFAELSTQRILCGFNPEGQADETLVVGRVTGSKGKILATLVNYACHPTTLAWENRLISPDFVGALRETVESHTSGAPCLFLQGASGDLAPREQYTGDTAVADAHGRELGYTVLAVLEGMLPSLTRLEYSGPVESGAPLATWKYQPNEPLRALAAICREVELPLKEIPTLEEIEEDLKTCQDRVIAERLRRKRETRWVVGNGQTAQVSLWAWRVGDAFIIGQANEAFSCLQMELRRRYAPHPVVVMNLVNGGEAGYLPPENVYTRDMYEVSQTPFDRGSLERMLDTAAAAIGELGGLGHD